MPMPRGVRVATQVTVYDWGIERGIQNEVFLPALFIPGLNLLLLFIERCKYCGLGRCRVVALLWPDRAYRSIRRPRATGMKR